LRDEFTTKIKDVLFKRAGAKCSNPNCRKPTCGPHTDTDKIVNIGVAAHITAAEIGGPRYNEGLSADERKSFDNGIWLCQDCAKLIDSDEKRYNVDIIRKWKELSEAAALLDIENPVNIPNNDDIEDKKIIRFFSQCFDRPAFQDEFMQEGSIEAFDKAMEDTIIALNTGCLRDRNGSIVFQYYGKSYLSNYEWREKMDKIVDLLRAIRSRYQLAIQLGQIHIGSEYEGKQFYCFHDHRLAIWFDETRADILYLFSSICKEVGIHNLKFPRTRRIRF
jgi:hypothetical protein